MIDKSAFIHLTATVEEGASIGANAYIGPFRIVEPHVEIDEGTVLKSHVVVNGHTRIGCDNEVYQFTSIGEVNQGLKYADESTHVEINDRSHVCESITIYRGTVQGGGVAKVGSDNSLVINAHAVYGYAVDNRYILANNTTLTGHVPLDDSVIIGGMTAVHQFCITGTHMVVDGCSGVVQDVPPCIVAQDNHVMPFGVDIEDLKCRGFTREVVATIYNAYKTSYRSGKTLEGIRPEIAGLMKQYPGVQAFSDLFECPTCGLIHQ